MAAARYLLDTDICIHVQRQRTPALLERFQGLAPGTAIISAITWGELRFGAEKSQRRAEVLRVLDEFATVVPVAPVPVAAGAIYGAVRATLEARGQPIGNNDLWIAAHARAADLTLITANGREFARVPGLAVESWA